IGGVFQKHGFLYFSCSTFVVVNLKIHHEVHEEHEGYLIHILKNCVFRMGKRVAHPTDLIF
ncbi:MAG: hypothetical protein KAJ07_01575, partial [Planctomycetes bacterium]|nr:hypothetical protein [Planctomycetota bacterium]